MTTRLSFRDQVAAEFRAHPDAWLPARRFMAIGGACGWRTRISNCRRELGMDIVNKQVTVTRREPGGTRRWTTSFYKFVPPAPPTVDARGQVWLWPREEAQP